MGDGSNLIADSGMESWALTATGGEFMAESTTSLSSSSSSNPKAKKSGWEPGDSPAENAIEMRRAAGMGVV
jgi:hypothetical protein